MKIRLEQIGDEAAIYELTRLAFETTAFSNGAEAPIVDQLRKDQDLALSLVAVEDGKDEDGAILGHVAFSRVTIDGAHNGWYGLGPVSVHPERQKQGIGSKLIKDGLAQIKNRGAIGCVLIGNPDYYSRFGFVSDGNLKYGDVPSQFIQWLSFGADKASGVLKYARAFDLDQ